VSMKHQRLKSSPPFTRSINFRASPAIILQGTFKRYPGGRRLSDPTEPFPTGIANGKYGATVRAQGHHARWLNCAVNGHSTVVQATSSVQLGSRYHIRAAVRFLQPGDLVIEPRYRRRDELAKYDIRRSTIRRSRDDMRRYTIRLPPEPATEVAKLVSSLRRLELPARATRCALVFG
jgi:hypothetical protein